jgi:hypothetical protein
MKANLLNKHLETSRVQLKKHTFERATAILKAVEHYETANLSNYMND